LYTVHCTFGQDAVLPEDRLLLAEGLLTRGLHALAAEEYAALAELDNATPGIFFRLGECYNRLEKWPEAEAAFARLVEKFPASVEAVRAQLLRAQKTPAQTVALLTPFREWRGDPALECALLLALANAHEKPADAISAYDEILRRHPNDPTAPLARLNAGLALLASDSPDDHKRGGQYLLNVAREKTDPQWAAEAIYALAQHEYAKKNYTDSAGYFALLARESPGSPRTQASRLQAAWTSFLSDDRDAALKLLDAHPVADPNSPDQQSWLYLRANLLRLNDDPGARAAYEKLLHDEFSDLDPRFIDARFEYAVMLYEQKEFVPLSRFFGQDFEFSAHDEAVAWMKAVTALQTEQLNNALTFFQNFEKDFPESPWLADAINQIATILSEQGKHVEAAETFTRCAKDHPDAEVASYAWACAGYEWMKANENTKAIAAFQKSINIKPHDFTALRLARLAFEEKQYDVADAAACHIIDRFPQSQYRANAFLLRGQTRAITDPASEAADNDLRDCLNTNPGRENLWIDDIHVNARFLLGQRHHEAGRFPEAAECFQALFTEQGPWWRYLTAPLYLWLARFQLEAGQPALAETAANNGLTNTHRQNDDATNQTLYCLLARALHAQGKNTKTIESLDDALAYDANTPDAITGALLLGQLYILGKDFRAADVAFQDAIQRAATPEFLTVRADAYLGLAQSAEAAEKTDAALRYYLTVALLFDDPERVPAALDAAIALCEKTGRPADAKKHLGELLERYPDSPQAVERNAKD